MNKLSEFIFHIGFDADDSDDMSLKKRLLVGASLFLILAGVIWGLMYFFFGEMIAGCIPLGYSAVSSLSIVFFALTHRYPLFRFCQLLLILLLPWFLMISLGGFINSSAVVLWSLICPLSALIFDKPRRALLWFLAFVGVIAISAILYPFFDSTNNLSPTIIQIFFVMNISAVSAIVFVLLFYFVIQTNELQKSLQTLSETDELTGLYNRRGFFAIAEKQCEIASRNNLNLSFVFLDIDGFKSINDEHGHKMGDIALVDTAEILKDTFRSSDIIARIGGDEFVIMTIESLETNLEMLIERLKENLKAHNIKANIPYGLSLSHGITHFDPEHACSIDELISNADKMMYEQKKRNS